MTIAPESTLHSGRTAHPPRPLPVWLQAGAGLLLFWNGLQAIIPHKGPPITPTDQTASSTASLARFGYTYQPDGLRAAGKMQPSFQYAGYYAHAPGMVSVTQMHAYAPSTGRWDSPQLKAEVVAPAGRLLQRRAFESLRLQLKMGRLLLMGSL